MTVVSFYSFKGGVGRTFLAVETAAQLACRGLRVCVWDLDLEAPALHRHAQLAPAVADLRTGTIDLIEGAAVDGRVAGDAVDQALVHLDLDATARLSLLLPAGADSLDGLASDGAGPYAERYWAIDWAAELASNRAVNSFLSITDHLAGQFDLVVIDARTGLTDLGYLSSRVLADAVVLVFGLSEQNLEGLRTANAAIARQVGSEPAPPTYRVANLVPDKVERASNPRLAGAYRTQANALSERGLAPDLELPLVPARLMDDLIPSLPGGLPEEAEPFDPLVSWVLDHTTLTVTLPEPRTLRAETFDTEVSDILVASGWTHVVGRRPDLDHPTDLVMRPPAVSHTRRPVLIECIIGSPRKEHIQRLSALRRSAEESGGRLDALLVAERPASVAVLELADREGIDVVSLPDLLKPMIDLGPMLSRLEDRLERSGPGAAVDLTARVRGLALNPDLVTYLERWSRSRPVDSFLLLGETSAGRTSVLVRLAQRLNRRWADPEEDHATIGVVVDAEAFRDLALTDLDAVILSAATRQGATTTLRQVAYLRRSGYLVALIDGVDGVGAGRDAVSGWSNGPVIVTAQDRDAAIRLGLEPGTIAELDPLTGAQRAQMFANFALDDAEMRKILAVVAERPELEALLETAATSSLLVDAVFASGRVPASVADAIEIVLGKWLDSHPAAPRNEILRELANVALDSFSTDGRPVRLRIRLRREDRTTQKMWKEVIATCPFLVRSGDASYSFAHASILEYFVAEAIIRMRPEACLDVPRLPDAVLERWRTEVASQADAIVPLRSMLKDETHPLRARTNAFLLLARCGASHTVHGARLDRADLSGLDLRGARLTGAHLISADLRSTDLTGAYLDEADLRGATLDHAILRDARLAGTDLREASMADADITGAEMRGANLTDLRSRPKLA